LYDDNDEIDGEIFADLKIRMGVKYSLLMEVYLKNVGTKNGCFLYFNPVD